jgi:hypothetical protein
MFGARLALSFRGFFFGRKYFWIKNSSQIVTGWGINTGMQRIAEIVAFCFCGGAVLNPFRRDKPKLLDFPFSFENVSAPLPIHLSNGICLKPLSRRCRQSCLDGDMGKAAKRVPCNKVSGSNIEADSVSWINETEQHLARHYCLICK